MTYKNNLVISPRGTGNRPFSRRAFLRLAGLTALSAAVAGYAPFRSNPAASASAFRKPDVEVILTAQKTEWELAPGKVIKAWTYNGAVPGEAIRVREGDQVRVILKNDLPEPTTIHWHGIDVPTTMDGVPDISQPAVQPGETFIYEFEARPAGTRWYHTHFNSAQQQDLGLSAPFIIEPLIADTPTDREYTLMLDDWVTASTTSNESPKGSGMMDGDSMMGRGGMMGDGSSGDKGMMDGGGMMGGMMSGDEPVYDTFTINGKAFPATELLKVKRGERVRLRLINASNVETFTLRLAGHRLQVTHTDGNPLQTPVEVDALSIAPSERYDVTFIADNPGKWPLYALDPAHTEGGLKTLVGYEGFESASAAELKYSTAGLTLWSYDLGQGVDVLPPAKGREQSYELLLSGGPMMSEDPNVWTINGQVYPDTDILKASQNQLVRVHLFNMSMHAHPFHLHGQSFRVLSVNGQGLSAPLIKDTVELPAMMGTVDLEFVAFNPGDWMFHCHKPLHMDGGMATLMKIA
jgi:FtsP/CotA-like multicopper oxidase with cupredoxin domain